MGERDKPGLLVISNGMVCQILRELVVMRFLNMFQELLAANKVPYLKCLYTNAHSKRKLEALDSPRFYIISICKTWGDESPD